MKTALLIVLFLISTYSLGINRLSNVQMQKIEKLKSGNSWSSIILNLAELHMMGAGPVDQLIEAIVELQDDLNTKLDSAGQEFERTTAQHQADVKRIQGEIDQAIQDQASTQDFLNNILHPQKDNLESEIANLDLTITKTQQYIQEEIENREREHSEYQVRIQEHQDGIAAITEALQLLDGLEGEGLSLAQVKKVKVSLEKVQSKLGKDVETAFIKVLLALSTSEFADKDALQQVTGLLLQVKQNLETSLTDENNEEVQAQQDHENDVKQKNNEITQMSLDISNKKVELERTIESIADQEQFIKTRQYDQKGFEKDLVEENDSFDRATKNYDDLVNQFYSELQACEDALSVLSSPEIAGYIGGRMQQDVVIDQAHGQKIDVNDWQV